MNILELMTQAGLNANDYNISELSRFEYLVRQDQIKKDIEAIGNSLVLCKQGCIDVLRKQNGDV